MNKWTPDLAPDQKHQLTQIIYEQVDPRSHSRPEAQVNTDPCLSVPYLQDTSNGVGCSPHNTQSLGARNRSIEMRINYRTALTCRSTQRHKSRSPPGHVVGLTSTPRGYFISICSKRLSTSLHPRIGLQVQTQQIIRIRCIMRAQLENVQSHDCCGSGK